MAFKIGDVRDALRLYTNWLLAKVLGLDVLTNAEKEELKNKDRLPTKSLNLVERSYILGRLKSILTSSEYGKIDYEELVSKANEIDLSPIEKKALEQVKRKAVSNLQSFSRKVEDTVLEKLAAEDALGDLQKEQHQRIVQAIETDLKDLFENGWHLTVETELHAAKTQGIAQSILNGIGPYKGNGGPDARVSVIPKPTACEDCKIQYLDTAGNPKIFKLSELISNGTNADAKHSKTKGIHTFWRATLPPLHPRCRCDLQFIPDGASWNAGKLVMPGGLSKAIGDSKLSATVKPQGAPANKAEPANMNPPTMAGSKSPLQGGNSASTVKPAKPKQEGAKGGEKNMVPCPMGGGDACRAAGGSGNENHEAGGASMKAHQEYQMKHQQGSSDIATSMKVTADQQEHSLAVANPQAQDLKNLAQGTFTSVKPLGDKEKGVTESYKVHIQGLGNAIVKPPAYSDSKDIQEGMAMATGAHTTPLGTAHKREKAFYQGAMMFGLTSHVPPTEVRSFNGQEVSAQKWMEGFSPAALSTISAGNVSGNLAKGLLELCPADKVEAARTKLNETIIAGALFNHNDQHGNNILASKDFDDYRMIDNSAAFATGLDGFCCQIFAHMHRAGLDVKVPDHLMHKFKNTTLSDVRRGIGDTIEDWAAGQTFLRMKYITFLQEREGKLDYEKFRNANYGNTTGIAVSPHPGYWDDIQYERTPGGGYARDSKGGMIPVRGQYGTLVSPEYNRRKANGTLANQMFESFAKQWIMDSKNLPDNHPDRIAAEELDKIGVFMGPGFAANQDEYRSNGDHRKYEKSIVPGYPPVDVKSHSKAKSSGDEASTVKPTNRRLGTAKTDVSTEANAATVKKPDKKAMKLFELDSVLDANKNLSPAKKEAIKEVAEKTIKNRALNKSLRLFVPI